jgi:nitrile hydratase accessory protein
VIDVAGVPRRNGELVFDEPWQGRAFAVAVALCEGGAYEWDEFQRALAARVAAGEAPYYEQWLDVLERVAAGRGLVSPGELERRAGELRDHEDHDHDQGGTG